MKGERREKWKARRLPPKSKPVLVPFWCFHPERCQEAGEAGGSLHPPQCEPAMLPTAAWAFQSLPAVTQPGLFKQASLATKEQKLLKNHPDIVVFVPETEM